MSTIEPGTYTEAYEDDGDRYLRDGPQRSFDRIDLTPHLEALDEAVEEVTKCSQCGR